MLQIRIPLDTCTCESLIEDVKFISLLSPPTPSSRPCYLSVRGMKGSFPFNFSFCWISFSSISIHLLIKKITFNFSSFTDVYFFSSFFKKVPLIGSIQSTLRRFYNLPKGCNVLRGSQNTKVRKILFYCSYQSGCHFHES